MTETEKFMQLNGLLPTVSREDTKETQREVGVFRKLFIALCPKDACK